MDTYSVIAKSETVLESVIEDLDLEISLSSLRDQITVEPIDQSEVLSIQVQDENPFDASNIANAVTESFEEVISETMAVEKINILSKAVPSTATSYPNNLRNLLIGTIIGLVISLALVIFRVLTNHMVKDQAEAENITGFKKLGTLSTFTEEDWLILKIRPKKTEKKDEESEEFLSRVSRRRI